MFRIPNPLASRLETLERRLDALELLWQQHTSEVDAAKVNKPATPSAEADDWLDRIVIDPANLELDDAEEPARR
jgi:hypothetical protein